VIAKYRVMWISLSLVGLVVAGCASSPAPTPTAMAQRMPFPQYGTHRAPAIRGGAAWRVGEREPALALDGQSCGIALDGRVRCWRIPPVAPTPLAAVSGAPLQGPVDAKAASPAVIGPMANR
jgi:hypothetical protein